MVQWPADRVARQPIDGLLPYARNARTHSDKQIAQIAASIREWGWTMPVLVDEEGGIIAGHGRVLAARKLGLADVPVMVARGWTRAQKHNRQADLECRVGRRPATDRVGRSCGNGIRPIPYRVWREGDCCALGLQ
jgi:predicted alpha/beta hydrolase